MIWFGGMQEDGLMCGRYHFSKNESVEIRRIAEQFGNQLPGGNDEVAPSDSVPVLYQKDGQVVLGIFTWGLTGGDESQSVISIRAESVDQNAYYCQLFQNGRCVVPSTGFFEWAGSKQKYLFRLPKADTLYMAGLSDNSRDKPHFALLTTEANRSFSGFHERMPLVLLPEQIDLWLGNEQQALKILRGDPPMLNRVPIPHS